MDLEKQEEGKGVASSCSICLELVLDRGARSIARLHCGHEFHLDCIGSAFNAKGAMQCPNCRKVEKGRWLYANGHCSPADLDLDGWRTEDIFDLNYSELPFGFQWCPFRGFTQLASLFEEGEFLPNTYHELMGSIGFGDHSNASSSTHHPSGLGGQSSAEMMNSHSYSAIDTQAHNWQQQPPLSFSVSASVDQPASQLGSRLARNDPGGRQRLGSFVQPHPFSHGSTAHSGSNMVTSLGPPVGEARGHARVPGSHAYQRSIPSSALRNFPFAPVRRLRPRGLMLTVATSSSAEVSGGFYGFSVPGTMNRSVPDGDSIVGRHFDRMHGWSSESFTPLPWIPLDGESQWWSPFNPNPHHQSTGMDSVTRNFFPQRPTSERLTQSRQDSSYQRMLPSRMPPFM